MDELEGIKEEKDDNGDGGTLSHLFFLRSQEKIKKWLKRSHIFLFDHCVTQENMV